MSSIICQHCSRELKNKQTYLLHQRNCKRIQKLFNIDNNKIDKTIIHSDDIYPYTDKIPSIKVGNKLQCKYCDTLMDGESTFRIHYETCAKRYEYEYMNNFRKVKNFKISKYHGILHNDIIDAHIHIYNDLKKELISVKRLITFKNGCTILVK